MAIYEFVSRDGHRIERHYSMTRAPKVGARIRVRGVEYRRVPNWDTVQLVPKPDHAHVSHQLARWHPDAPHHDHRGRACFENDREIREFAARNGYVYDGLSNAADGAHDAPSNNLDEYWRRTLEVRERFRRAQEMKYHLEQQAWATTEATD